MRDILRIINPLQLNDLEIKKFLILVIALQLSILGLSHINILDVNFYWIKGLISLYFLLFIPGFIILRILRLHKLDLIKNLIYSLVFSFAIIVFMGLLINIMLPMLGWTNPLSPTPLLGVLTGIIIILSIICFIRDRDYAGSPYIEINTEFLVKLTILLLFPVCSIFGTFLINYYDNEIALLLLICLISFTTIFINIRGSACNKYYSSAIFSISLALLYHNSLVSFFLNGQDIQSELTYSSLVYENLIWDPTIFTVVNTTLSTNLLVPILSQLSGISILWIYKAVYPFWFSFVPLGLYYIYRNYFNDRIAFLSVLFFIFQFSFFKDLVALPRQGTAELFIVCLLILFLEKRGLNTWASLSTIVVSFLIITAHYGTAFLYIFLLAMAFIIQFITPIFSDMTIKHRLIGKSSKYKDFTEVVFSQVSSCSLGKRGISLMFLGIFIILVLFWYIYYARSPFYYGVTIIDNIIESYGSGFTSDPNEGMAVITIQATSYITSILKYLNLFTQFLISVGLISTLFGKKYINPRDIFISLCVANFGLLILCLLLPGVSTTLGISRIYHMSLLFLSPFCIIGASKLFGIISSIKGSLNDDTYLKDRSKVFYTLISVFLTIFFLFNVGLISEVTDTTPISYSLNSNYRMNYALFTEQEWIGCRYTEIFDLKTPVYTEVDLVEMLKRNTYYYKTTLNYYNYPIDIADIQETSYLMFRSRNVLYNEVKIGDYSVDEVHVDSKILSNNRQKIYDNTQFQLFGSSQN